MLNIFLYLKIDDFFFPRDIVFFSRYSTFNISISLFAIDIWSFAYLFPSPDRYLCKYRDFVSVEMNFDNARNIR